MLIHRAFCAPVLKKTQEIGYEQDSRISGSTAIIIILPWSGRLIMNHLSLLILLACALVCVMTVTADKDPQQAAIWFDKGKDLASMASYAEAVSAFDMSLTFGQDDEAVWLEKGKALARLGKYAEATKTLEKAIALKPDDIEAWTQKGDAFNWLGKNNEALQAYDKVLELDPKNSYAKLKKNIIQNLRAS